METKSRLEFISKEERIKRRLAKPLIDQLTFKLRMIKIMYMLRNAKIIHSDNK
jgi:hypothetical protein